MVHHYDSDWFNNSNDTIQLSVVRGIRCEDPGLAEKHFVLCDRLSVVILSEFYKIKIELQHGAATRPFTALKASKRSNR